MQGEKKRPENERFRRFMKSHSHSDLLLRRKAEGLRRQLAFRGRHVDQFLLEDEERQAEGVSQPGLHGKQMWISGRHRAYGGEPSPWITDNSKAPPMAGLIVF